MGLKIKAESLLVYETKPRQGRLKVARQFIAGNKSGI
jgi:hypothetical protein